MYNPEPSSPITPAVFAPLPDVPSSDSFSAIWFAIFFENARVVEKLFPARVNSAQRVRAATQNPLHFISETKSNATVQIRAEQFKHSK